MSTRPRRPNVSRRFRAAHPNAASRSAHLDRRIAAAARRWLRTFERHVRNVDYASARPMFSSDVIAFGTYAAIVSGRPSLERQQWARVWPTIRAFRFRLDALRCVGGRSGVCVVVPWDSRGVRAEGTTYSRPGRATLFLVRRAGRWVAAHTHFSLAPPRAAGGAGSADSSR